MPAELSDRLEATDAALATRLACGDPAALTPLYQSLADLGNAYNVVEGLRLAPLSYVAVLRLAAVTLAPVAPLLLTMVPLNELVLRLFSFAL